MSDSILRRHEHGDSGDARRPCILIVVAPYYQHITDKLLRGARTVIEEHGWSWAEVEVPGALEIPAAIALAESHGEFDGYVALGCVIRGETTHYETVCNDSSRGIMQLNLAGACIGNGILTVENETQALARADPGRGNKGADAASAAISLVTLCLELTRSGQSAAHGSQTAN